MTHAGVPMSPEQARHRWRPWSPAEVYARLAGVDASWGVAGGWAVDLFVGEVTREHDDIEIAVPASSFPAVASRLAPFCWDVVGDGRVWPYPASLPDHHQTWLRDPMSGEYLLDVFREPHHGDTWICRRDPTIRLPHSQLYGHTADRTPYVIPEVVLLFKAPQVRPKDQDDFERVIERLPPDRERRLARWLSQVHGDHEWLARLPAA